ncbi:ABC transporter permease [Anaerocolumna sp. AGMB13020]|uniref:ABC transporter permease n=1 Tax=Anaerocolumna sp. AGMB13020 TaxID=3081750 RepID=UPI0029534F52|nr:ABC transporter permease [Anaerocolumna sp. AGMB13020]WOO35447.1 ABC transporter permease [Anaerocolumna sp. AGMB13020]
MNLKTQIITFIKYGNLLKKLVARDIKVRYRRSFLGLLWTVLNPLLSMIILTIVFSNLFKMSIANFPVYVLIGNIVFNFNSEATTQSLTSIIDNSSLIKKIYIPKYLFPISKVASSLVNFGFSCIALLIVMIFTKADFYILLITLWIPFIYLFMFTLGLSLILCSVNVFFRDIGHLYSVFLTAWTYLTPLFYSIEIVPNNIKKFIYLNPMFHYVTFFRAIILDGYYPDLKENIICFLFGLVTLIIGIIILKRTQDKFILHI